MIGFRFFKPLQNDKLMRTVTHTVDIPVYDENGKVVGRESKDVIDVEEYNNPAPNTFSRYKDAALWCSKNGAVIVDKGDYYEVCAIPAPTPEELAEQALAEAKAERAAAVAAITVEVDGMVFDGDEKAQERMSRTITAAVSTGAPMTATTTWVLADNTVAQVSMQQLVQALRLAGEKQTELWTVPYQDAME